MGRERFPEALKAELDHALKADAPGERAANRRCFRDMVKGEIEDRPLSWGRRRSLVRFAACLDIDAFEARLLIRAVEYECGHVPPAAMADVETAVDPDYLVRLEHGMATRRLLVAVLAAVLLSLVAFGLAW